MSRYAEAMLGTTRPLDRDKAEQDLSLHLKKATNADETAPKQKHVRSACQVATAILTARMHRVHVGSQVITERLVRSARAADSQR